MGLMAGIIGGSAIRGVSNMATGITKSVEQGKTDREGLADGTVLGNHGLDNRGMSIADRAQNTALGINTAGQVANNQINTAGGLQSQKMGDQTSLLQQQMADRSRNINQFGQGLFQDEGQHMAEQNQVNMTRASTPLINDSFNNVSGGIANNSHISIGNNGSMGGGGNGGGGWNGGGRSGSMARPGDMSLPGQTGGYGLANETRGWAKTSGQVLGSDPEDKAITDIGGQTGFGDRGSAGQLALENHGFHGANGSLPYGDRSLPALENGYGSGSHGVTPFGGNGFSLSGIRSGGSQQAALPASETGGVMARADHPVEDALAGGALGAGGMYALKNKGMFSSGAKALENGVAGKAGDAGADRVAEEGLAGVRSGGARQAKIDAQVKAFESKPDFDPSSTEYQHLKRVQAAGRPGGASSALAERGAGVERDGRSFVGQDAAGRQLALDNGPERAVAKVARPAEAVAMRPVETRAMATAARPAAALRAPVRATPRDMLAPMRDQMAARGTARGAAAGGRSIEMQDMRRGALPRVKLPGPGGEVELPDVAGGFGKVAEDAVMAAADGGMIWHHHAHGGMVTLGDDASLPFESSASRHKAGSSFSGWAQGLGESCESFSGGWTANAKDEISDDMDLRSLWR